MATTKNERATLWLDKRLRGPFGDFLWWALAKPCTDREIALAMSTNTATVRRVREVHFSRIASGK
jgi:hypothetical protein